MSIPFFDLKRICLAQKTEIDEAVSRVLESGSYILGSAVCQFESDFSLWLTNRTSSNSVVTCNSGTDALILSLLASGVEPGDEVITPSHTAIPGITAIQSIGAVPIFVDVSASSWVIEAPSADAAITPKTRAILCTHLYGNMVNMDAMAKMIREKGRTDIALIEDVAQATGSSLDSRMAGTFGDFGSFSFYPTKNLGALGDGGAIFCRDSNKIQLLKMLRNYGQKDRYLAVCPRGTNSRLDEIQAAILSVRLKVTDEHNRQRSAQVSYYRKELANLPIKFQCETDRCKPAWHLCVLECRSRSERDFLITHLESKGIQNLIHYPMPTHLQPAFLGKGTTTPIKLPVTEHLCERIISIPMNPGLSQNELCQIVSAIQSYFV